MNNYAADWMIIETTTAQEDNTSKLYRFYGNKEDVRQLLADMIHRYKEKNPNGYCRGTESLEEVDLYGMYELQSFAEYDSYKVTFTAKEFASVCHILKDGTIR